MSDAVLGTPSTPNTPEKDPPALFNHCVEIWNAMNAEAQQLHLQDGDQLVAANVWEGFLTQKFREHRLAVPQYTHVTKALQQMDCVRQIRRGGGSAMSQWIMVRQPTMELFRVRFGMSYKSKMSQKTAQASQMLRDLAKRVDALEGWQANHERTH